VGSQVAEQGNSVRATEELVHSMLHPAPKPEKKSIAKPDLDPNVREAQRELERALGCKVHVNDRNGKGSIVIDYASLEDFDRVLEVLGVSK